MILFTFQSCNLTVTVSSRLPLYFFSKRFFPGGKDKLLDAVKTAEKRIPPANSIPPIEEPSSQKISNTKDLSNKTKPPIRPSAEDRNEQDTHAQAKQNNKEMDKAAKKQEEKNNNNNLQNKSHSNTNTTEIKKENSNPVSSQTIKALENFNSKNAINNASWNNSSKNIGLGPALQANIDAMNQPKNTSAVNESTPKDVCDTNTSQNSVVENSADNLNTKLMPEPNDSYPLPIADVPYNSPSTPNNNNDTSKSDYSEDSNVTTNFVALGNKLFAIDDLGNVIPNPDNPPPPPPPFNKESFNSVKPKIVVYRPTHEELEEHKKNLKSKDGRTRAEKEKEAQVILDESINMINLILEHYKNNPEQILSSEEIIKWYHIMEKRENIIPLEQIEIDFYNLLKPLSEKYVPKKEEILKDQKDNFKDLKENSKIPLHLQNVLLKPNILPEDIEFNINAIQEAIELLKKNDLSINDTKLLSRNADTLTIDNEGTLKFTQEAYKGFPQNKEKLGFTYSTDKPEYNTIIDAIKNNNFKIANAISPPADSIVALAHTSHKTIIVEIKVEGQIQLVRIGMATSTKSSDTFFIDNNQVNNPDPVKRDKEQRGLIFSTFIIVSPEEAQNLTYDLEMTTYFKGRNSDGEYIVQKICDELIAKKESWTNNQYQHTYTATQEFVKTVAIISYEEDLRCLEQQLLHLNNELSSLSLEEQAIKLHELETQKNKIIEDKEKQRQFNQLPEHLQQLYKIEKLIEQQKQKELERKKKIEQDQEKNRRMEEQKEKLKQKEEEHEKIHGKSAKKKREEHMAKKQTENNTKTND